jgi:hypothetical protein
LAVFTAEGAVGVQEQAALELAGVPGVGVVELLEVIARRGGEAELVTDEVVENGAGVAADGAVRFVRDERSKSVGEKSCWYLLLKRRDWTVVTTISALRQSSRFSL